MNRSYFTKVIAMLISFGVVVYGIMTLKSPEFSQKMESSEAMSLLTGGDLKPMNWCPENTVKIDLLSPDGQILKSFSDKAQFASLCELMIGGFNSEGIDSTSYKKILTAYDAGNKSRMLEGIIEQDVYRVEGMPFKSPMLKKAIERLK